MHTSVLFAVSVCRGPSLQRAGPDDDDDDDDDDNVSVQNKLKVASLAAKLERYKEAIELFESVANTCLDNNLLKYSVRGHLLCAGICQLCVGDLDAARQAVENYKVLSDQNHTHIQLCFVVISSETRRERKKERKKTCTLTIERT